MRTVPLGEVAEINPVGDRPAPDDHVSFVGMAQMDAVGAVARPLDDRLFSEVSKGYTIFRDGDILAAKITPCWENGKVGQARLDQPYGAGSTEFHVIRPGVSLDERYLLHLLRTSRVRDTGELRMTGSAGQRRVPAAYLRGLEIPLPSVEEQRRIAAILDKADSICAKRRQVLDHLDALTQSIFYVMFGDPLSNSKGLPRRRIGDLALVVTGNSPRRSDSLNFGNGIEWIKTDNLGGFLATTAAERLSEAGMLRARMAPKGSVLVACIAGSRSSIGKASFVDRNVCFNQQMNAVIPSEELDSLYLLGQLKTAPELVRSRSTGGMKGLVSKSAFEDIEILEAPISRQRMYGEMIGKIVQQMTFVESVMCSDQELRSMLHDGLFDGLDKRNATRLHREA